MPSAWITTRATKDGGKRYRVRYRPGGREAAVRYGGSFRTMREAKVRRDAIAGDLAALRMPELSLVGPDRLPTLAEMAERWRASRVDVSAGTMQTYAVALGRLFPRLGDTPVERIDAQTVADLVGELHAAGLRKQTIRKTVSVLAMVLDHGRVTPNPARDKLTVKMPREERRELHPPTAAHVEAVARLLPKQYRLPALVLDATGMRIGELEGLTWGDVDEPRQRLARFGRRGEDGTREVGPGPGRALRRRHAARGARRSCPRTASLSGLRRRSLPHRDHPRLHRGRRAGVLAARLASPPRLAAPPGRDAVGADRRTRRPRRPRDDGSHLYPRRSRRGRA
jgi:integrase